MTTQKFLEEKLKRVRDFYNRYYEKLCEDKIFNTLLEEYKKNFKATQEAFSKVGVDKICAECGQTKRVCCGLGMELYCEDALLLINLYLDVPFPEKRIKDFWCFFLTEKGCLLQVRPLLCRNFFCDEIQELLPKEKLIYLQEALGPEAETLFKLLERVRTICPGI